MPITPDNFVLTDDELFVLSLLTQTCPECDGTHNAIIRDKRSDELIFMRCKKCNHEWDIDEK